jgi:hypothetical protein
MDGFKNSTRSSGPAMEQHAVPAPAASSAAAGASRCNSLFDSIDRVRPCRTPCISQGSENVPKPPKHDDATYTRRSGFRNFQTRLPALSSVHRSICNLCHCNKTTAERRPRHRRPRPPPSSSLPLLLAAASAALLLRASSAALAPTATSTIRPAFVMGGLWSRSSPSATAPSSVAPTIVSRRLDTSNTPQQR